MLFHIIEDHHTRERKKNEKAKEKSDRSSNAGLFFEKDEEDIEY